MLGLQLIFPIGDDNSDPHDSSDRTYYDSITAGLRLLQGMGTNDISRTHFDCAGEMKLVRTSRDPGD